MIERRKSPRTKLTNELIVRIRASIQARIINISPCGALLELGAPLRPSLECDIRFREASDGLRVRARIHRCRLEKIMTNGGMERKVIYRAGVEFLHASEDSSRRVMEQVVELMSGRSGSSNNVHLEIQ